MSSADAGYRAQQAWRQIQAFLPADYQLGPGGEPMEEWWDWRGHRVHLDRFANPAAKFKVILFHGVGTNGRQMSTILGRPLSRSGFETVAPDLPGYGVTQVARGATIRYEDWVDAAIDLIDAEAARDPRPIILYGLSAGGMLAYQAAAANPKVKGIVGMTFLDQRIQRVSDETAINVFTSRVGVPLVHLAVRLGLGSIKIPMRLVSKMHALVNNARAMQAFYADKTSAGNAVSLRFLSSYALAQPAVEPEDFAVCPILLTQPEDDRWTPIHLSEVFLSRLQHVRTEVVLLQEAGHYPLERLGLEQLHSAVVKFAASL